MDIVLAMLASSAAAKVEEKKWSKIPHSIHKNLEVSQGAQNFALYRYLANNAMRYPKEWLDNGYGASVVASMAIHNQDVVLRGIKILHKSDGLEDIAIYNEVEKALHRARNSFPNTQTRIELDLPFEWKMMG